MIDDWIKHISRIGYIVAIVLLTIVCSPLNGQNEKNKNQEFTLSIEVFRTRADTLNPEQVISSKLFESTDKLEKSTSKDIYWIKIDFDKLKKDSLSLDHNDWYLRLGSSDIATLFFQSSTGIKGRDFGFLAPISEYKPIISNSDVPFSISELINSRYLYVKLQRLTVSRQMHSLEASIVPKETMLKIYSENRHKRLEHYIPAIFFAGIVVIILLFSITVFIAQKKREYLFYSLYLFSLLAYLSRRAFGLNDYLFGSAPILEYMTHMELQILINLFYILFAKYFLNTFRDYKPLDKAINILTPLLVIFTFTSILLISFHQFSANTILMDVHRAIMVVFGLAGNVYLLIKAKSKLVYFIVIGSLFYTAGALAMLFLVKNNYMIIGSSLEIFMFTLGLSYKSRQVLLENTRIQQDLLRLNIKALRAQMNPHFIFNSLGSIKHLVRRNETEQAISYLSKFSKLLRQILETSNNEYVILKTEIDLLKNYLELESLRFKGQFNYEVEVDESLDIYNYEIPILLIQPHVENAVIHGLLPKDDHAQLNIAFKDIGSHIKCIIRDNGIGREESNKRKSTLHVPHKSLGQSIVQERVNQMSTSESKKEVVLIQDILNHNSEVVGTQVTIHLPKQY